MNPKTCLEILAQGVEIVEGLGCTWWADHGTVLGGYRDDFSEAFLTHDSDFDVGVLGQEYVKPAFAAFAKRGFSVFLERRYHDLQSHIAFRKDGEIFDVFFYNERGDDVFCACGPGEFWMPAKMVSPPVDCRMGSFILPAPYPIWEYLKLRYGPTWRTPVKEKIPWEREARNLRPFGGKPTSSGSARTRNPTTDTSAPSTTD